MPVAYASLLPAGFWPVVTRFGEAQLMLPSGLALVAWLAWAGERRTAALWCALIALAVGLTTASKIAFIGWGVGSASLNFTGVSGHAMHAATVFPLLLRCFTASSAPPTRRFAVAAGYALAALVAVSRAVIGAHSPSECVAGFALGSAASAFALTLGTVPQKNLPRWLLAALVAAQLLNPAAAPTLPTHDIVTRLALSVSGHERPYTRAMLLRRERERLKALRQAMDALASRWAWNARAAGSLSQHAQNRRVERVVDPAVSHPRASLAVVP